MRRLPRTLTGVGLSLGLLAAATMAGPAASAAPRTETMTHYSCDRTSKVTVSVTWVSTTTAQLRWTLSGRNVKLRIVGLDYNGSKPTIQQDYFTNSSRYAYVRSGSKTGGVTWNPKSLRRLHEVEARIWTGSGCGINVVKRLNDHIFSPTRTTPQSYAKSKALRDRIVAEAWRQYRGVNHESGNNCSKYSRPFYDPDICHAWCADFAWWIWNKAGVKQANIYNSPYTDDFADEWRVQFKKLGGAHKPAKGDVIIWSHSTDGVNGHVGVVVATNGWKVKIIHGNWSDRVSHMSWIDPFTSRQDSGRKRVIGFASPA